MLRKLAESSTGLLLKNHAISEQSKAVYLYGFELFWSTFLGVISILVLSLIFHYPFQAIIFLLYFLPIRTFAGGYHAESYGRCFLLSNAIAFICIWVSGIIEQRLDCMILAICIVFISWVYIWKHAPVVTGNHPLKDGQIEKSKKYVHIAIIIEVIMMLVFIVLNHGMLYTAVVTTCVVAFMMYIAISRGEDEV